jgi:site-specific recombinase XerD
MPTDPTAATIEAFVAHLGGAQGLAATTQRTYGYLVSQFAGWMAPREDRGLATATVEDIEAWIAAQTRRGLAPRTRQLAIAALRSFYTWLPGRDDNPAARVRTPRIPPADVRPYTPEEVTAMLAAAHTGTGLAARVDEAVLLTLRFTGLRVRELVDLELEAVDLDVRRLDVVGKGGHQRLVPIAWDLRTHLHDYLRWTRPSCPPSRWLFASPRSRPDGTWWGRISPPGIRRVVRSFGEAAGVPGRHHPHRWRHTFATELLRAGVDVHSAQRLLGHVKAGKTATYLHLVDDELCEAVDQVYDLVDVEEALGASS